MLKSVEGSILLDVTDEEIDAIIAEFEGDPWAAIRALLHDLNTFAVDSKAAVSPGFVRGLLLSFRVGDGLPEKKWSEEKFWIIHLAIQELCGAPWGDTLPKLASSNSEGCFGIGGVNATLFELCWGFALPVGPADVETRRNSLMGKAECAKRASRRSSAKVGGGSDI